MSQSNFVSLCGYVMICDTPWLSRLCELSTWRVFQLSLKNIQNIFLELSAGKVRQNCRATIAIPPGTSVATIVTICCNHRDGEYFLHWIARKLGSTATSTVITRLLPLTNYISDAENETQRALLGHTNGNNEMRSPSAAAMLTMVAAATIVRFPPVTRGRWVNSLFRLATTKASEHQITDTLWWEFTDDTYLSTMTPKFRWVYGNPLWNQPENNELFVQKRSFVYKVIFLYYNPTH